MTKHRLLFALAPTILATLSVFGAQSGDGMLMSTEPPVEHELQTNSSLPLIDGVVTEGEYAHIAGVVAGVRA